MSVSAAAPSFATNLERLCSNYSAANVADGSGKPLARNEEFANSADRDAFFQTAQALFPEMFVGGRQPSVRDIQAKLDLPKELQTGNVARDTVSRLALAAAASEEHKGSLGGKTRELARAVTEKYSSGTDSARFQNISPERATNAANGVYESQVKATVGEFREKLATAEPRDRPGILAAAEKQLDTLRATGVDAGVKERAVRDGLNTLVNYAQTLNAGRSGDAPVTGDVVGETREIQPKLNETKAESKQRENANALLAQVKTDIAKHPDRAADIVDAARRKVASANLGEFSGVVTRRLDAISPPTVAKPQAAKPDPLRDGKQEIDRIGAERAPNPTSPGSLSAHAESKVNRINDVIRRAPAEVREELARYAGGDPARFRDADSAPPAASPPHPSADAAGPTNTKPAAPPSGPDPIVVKKGSLLDQLGDSLPSNSAMAKYLNEHSSGPVGTGFLSAVHADVPTRLPAGTASALLAGLAKEEIEIEPAVLSSIKRFLAKQEA